MDALNQVYHPLLHQVVTLEAFNEQSKDQVLLELQHCMEQVKDRAKAQNCSELDIQDASYAIAALIDEQIPLRCPKLAGKWRSALLQHLFEDNQGGTYFFERLDSLLAQPARNEVLRIYAICLAYGFRGKYSQGDRDELASLRQQVRRRLPNAQAELELCTTVSPANIERQARLDPKRLIWPTTIALCLAMICMASFRRRLDKTSESLLRQLPNILDPQKLS